MPSMDYESRAFLMSLLREANVVEEILEDVADACELAEFSVFSLASKEITVKTLAEKLYLTKQEATALRNCAVARLAAEPGQPAKPNSKNPHKNALPDFTKMISVHVVASHTNAQHQRQRSMLSIESFMGKDGEKKKVDTSSYGSGETGYQWTDSTTDQESTVDNYGDSPKDRGYSRQDVHRPRSRKVHRAASGVGAPLTNTNLADHDGRCRPFVPRLQLEDAGLSYGPPNSVCPSYMSLDSLTPSELEQLADLPVDCEYYMSRKAKSVVEGAEKKPQRCRIAVHVDHSKLKGGRRIRMAAVPPLPSYRNVSHSIHKTTAAFEASKRALKERREQKERKMFEQSDQNTSHTKNKGRKAKRPSSRLLKPTKASLARLESVKARSEDRLMPYKAGSTSTIPSTLQVFVLPNRL